MASSTNFSSKWPKLRKIFFTKPMPHHRYVQGPAPVNDPPETHIPKAIPWNDYTDESSLSQNPLPINGTQEQNADESAKIFEKINKNLLGKILSPQMLFGPPTNSDDNSNTEKENGETAAGKESGDNKSKPEEQTGESVEDEKQVFELIDLTCPDMDNITKKPTTEPIELYDEDICMPNVEKDLAGETGKRKQSFPYLNIMTESSIRIVPGEFTNSVDPRINKSGNSRPNEENLQENKENSSKTKEVTANAVSERITSSTHPVKDSKEILAEEESVKRKNDVMSTISSNKPKIDPREINTGFNKQPASKIKITFNESPYQNQKTQKTQPDEKSSMESRKEKTVEKAGEIAQEKTKENQKNCSALCPGSPSSESTVSRNYSAELSRVDTTDVEERFTVGNSEKLSSVKNNHETAALCAKTRPFVETTVPALSNIGNTNIDKILEIGNDKKSNSEKNTIETMTFYSNNDQAQYNHSNGTVDEIPPLQENNANNNGTDNDPDDRFSTLEATAILRNVIEDKVKSLMKSELIELLVENMIADLHKSHSVLVKDLISRLHQQQKNICQKGKSTNRNERPINQEASPILNPVEEINSESSPSSITENLSPTQISQHQISETHVLPPPPLPPTLSSPECIPIPPCIPWCPCGNPLCPNNQQMMSHLQRMGLVGNMNSFPLSNQFPMIYSQLNNCNNGRGCPPNERQNNSNIPVDHSRIACEMEKSANHCHHGIPADISSIQKSTQKRTYNKKRKAGNETGATKPAKRGRKPWNTIADQIIRRRNSTGSDMTLATAIDSFHEATSNHGVYSENNAHSAYLNPQESFPTQNFNYGSSTMDHRPRNPTVFPPQTHHPQQIQNFPHFMQNQNSNVENVLRHNNGRSPLDFNLERLCPPPASIVQNQYENVSSPDINEEQQQMSSPIIPLQYVATSYEHSQPELELRTDVIYRQIPPNANNFIIFKTPEDHQKYLAQQQAHNTFQN